MDAEPAASAQAAPVRAHWLDAERLRVYPRIFLAVYAVAAVGYALSLHDGLDFRGQVLGADFITFYSAGTLALAGRGASAWDFDVLLPAQQLLFPAYAGLGFPWFYPPPFLLLVAPLALLPYLGALAVFVGSTATAWALTLRRAIRRPGAGWLVAAFPGLWACAAQGQNGLLTAALAGGSILALRRRPVLSGVLLGLLIIKPHLAVLFAVALVAGRAWRTMLVAAGTAIACLGASTLVLGRGALTAWLGSLPLASAATESGALPWTKMPSVFAMLRLLGASVEAAYTVHWMVAAAAAIGVWLVWRRSDSVELRGAALMTATFLANPHVHDYDLAWLAFPIAWLALYGLAHGWRRGDREVLVSAWLVPVVATAFATASRVQVAPLVLAALLWIVVRRVDIRPPVGFDRLSQHWAGLSRRWAGLSQR
jgi:hypothetical protein